MTAALEATRIIEDENLVENSREMGGYLLEQLMTLKKLPNVGDVRGVGLFCGVEFVTDQQSNSPITEQQMATLMGNVLGEGVIVGRTNNSLPGMNTIINIAPCLIITREQVDQIVVAVRKAIEKTF